MTQTAVQGWYQDPYGAPLLRWWDGAGWTEHSQTAPTPPPAPAPAHPQYAQPEAPRTPQVPQQFAPPQAPQTPQTPQVPQTPQAPQAWQPPQYAQPQAPQFAQPAAGGPEALLSAPALAVDQNFKWVDISTSYNILDRNGATVGSVAETGQNGARKALRFVSSMDKYLSRQFEIRDAAGVPFLVLSRGTKVVKAKVQVARPDGSPVGEIIQQQVVGRISFDLVAGGYPVGRLTAEGWYAFTFSITDHTGAEVGRIARDGLGLTLSVLGGTDHYYVEFFRPLPEPLRSLAVSAALTANTLLNPDSHGDQ